MQPIAIEQFEGPLDLLLQLIEREKLPITEVSLAQITEQYHRYVFEGSLPTEEIADYIVIASKLLLMKSKVLLPQLEQPEEEGESLVDQLKIYQQFHEKTIVLLQRWNNDQHSYPRTKAPEAWVVQFRPPLGWSAIDLLRSMERLVAALVPPKVLIRQLVDRAVTLQQRMTDLVTHLASRIQTSFRSFLGDRKNRTEIIVSFLALLELVKRRSVRIQQSDLFSDMTIEKL
ncbi:segregation/condensation protein A [Candidatus Uhrbacteria bacterium]|nr:segregation/condensation protein A [Candidatus Uhrbacteria bacterium]